MLYSQILKKHTNLLICFSWNGIWIVLWKYCFSWSINFRGFCGLAKTTKYNTQRNRKCPLYHFVPSMKPKIKEPTKQGIFLKPRKFATTNESIFTMSPFPQTKKICNHEWKYFHNISNFDAMLSLVRKRTEIYLILIAYNFCPCLALFISYNI